MIFRAFGLFVVRDRLNLPFPLRHWRGAWSVRMFVLIALNSFSIVFLIAGTFLYASTSKQRRNDSNEGQIELFEHAIKALELNAGRIEEGRDRQEVARSMLGAAAWLRVEQREWAFE